MIRSGENIVDGVTVEVVRKGILRINIRVARDGTVRMSVPKRWATLKDAERFLKSKWAWVVRTRAEALARQAAGVDPLTEGELAAFRVLLDRLNREWSAKTGEAPFAWKLREMKTLWGCCHWQRRSITYNSELARAPRELVEYVVVHEITHFKVHNHGPKFHAAMDVRLPGWRMLRRRLNRREWVCKPAAVTPPPRQKFHQPELW